MVKRFVKRFFALFLSVFFSASAVGSVSAEGPIVESVDSFLNSDLGFVLASGFAVLSAVCCVCLVVYFILYSRGKNDKKNRG